MRRASICGLVVLAALAGCTGPAGDTDDLSPGSADRSSIGPVPTEPGETVIPAESDRPTDGGSEGGGAGPEDERGIEVAGPTLDNTFPTNPYALPRVDANSCVIFTNPRGDVTVTVDSVRLVDQQPAGDPGLALGDQPGEHPQCAPGHPSYPVDTDEIADDCVGADLEPAERTGCPVEVQSVGQVGTDYTATLVLRLTASCTTLSGEPCARLAGRADPTPADPVTVTWSEVRSYCSCLVPRERDGAEFLPEESQGRCPSGTPSAAPSEEPEPDPDEEPGSEGEPSSEPPVPSPS